MAQDIYLFQKSGGPVTGVFTTWRGAYDAVQIALPGSVLLTHDYISHDEELWRFQSSMISSAYASIIRRLPLSGGAS